MDKAKISQERVRPQIDKINKKCRQNELDTRGEEAKAGKRLKSGIGAADKTVPETRRYRCS